MVSDFILDIIKESEKQVVNTAIAASMLDKLLGILENSDRDCKTKMSYIQSDMNIVSDKLGDSLKGQFGDSVKETLGTNKSKLEYF